MKFLSKSGCQRWSIVCHPKELVFIELLLCASTMWGLENTEVNQTDQFPALMDTIWSLSSIGQRDLEPLILPPVERQWNLKTIYR